MRVTSATPAPYPREAPTKRGERSLCHIWCSSRRSEGESSSVQPRRLLAPAVWLTATVVAAGLVTGAVRLAVRSVSSPAAASRVTGGHPRSDPPAVGAAGSVAAPANLGTADVAPTLPGAGGSEIGPSTRAGSATATAAHRQGAASGAGSPPSGSQTPQSSTTLSTDPSAQPSPTTTTSTTAPPAESTTTSSTTSSTTSTTEPTYVYRMVGGTVGVRCSGDSVSLSFASPADGYQSRVVDAGPDAVDVRFVGSRHISEIHVTCGGGQPNPEISERDNG